MPDPRKRGGEKRLARNEVCVLLDVALSNGGTDADRPFGAFDTIKARQPHDIDDDAWSGHAHAKHGDQCLSAGEDARVSAFLRQHVESLLNAFGAK